MQREEKRDRERERKEKGRKRKQTKTDQIFQQRQASETQRVNAVIRSAAALRAPLTSLQNVKKNPRTLPKICQKIINKYPKGCQKPSKSDPRESKKQGPKQNTNTSRFLSSPCCQNAPFWNQFFQKSLKGAPKAPKRIQKNSK